jgi:hypothetical protein
LANNQVLMENAKVPMESAGAPGKGVWAVVLVLVLAAAALLRFGHLDAAAVRSDEISFLNYALRGESLVELWKHPPWFNQIPLADSLPVVWCRLTGMAPGEATVRMPFALQGWLTVAGCALWMLRRRGWAAAVLVAVWMGLLPFHVYHSREAYYYALVMAAAAGMVLRGADFAAQAASSTTLRWRQLAEWTCWAMVTGMGHMSAWVVIGVVWICLVVAGWRGAGDTTRRKRHLVSMSVVAVVIAAGLSRWVLRALHEMQRAAADSDTHIGSAFGWVGPRVLPMFAGGANVVGVVLLVGLAGTLFWTFRRKVRDGGGVFGDDRLYAALTAIVWLGILGSYAYIMAVGGGGKGKWTYFAANLPGFVVWASMTAEGFWWGLGGRAGRWGTVGTAAVLAAVLGWPAWEVTRVEGKPTPYYALRAWLDGNLAEGDVAIVDRWLEPWNEMALYAPEKANVGFTVPDEPYEQYVANDWRGVTRRHFERNGAQAFIRLSRNHADRMGVWKWPETWFAHRSVVTNAAGLRLARTGFAPMEEFYLNPSRVEVEIFWDTREEAAAKQFARGAPAAVFFGPGWRLVKPWQQGDFRDYRLLEGGKASVEVRRPTGVAKKSCRVAVTGTAAGGETTVRAGRRGLMRFRPGEISTQVFEETFEGGENRLEFAAVEGPGMLAALEVRIEE